MNDQSFFGNQNIQCKLHTILGSLNELYLGFRIYFPFKIYPL